jgi:hypothetical protein
LAQGYIEAVRAHLALLHTLLAPHGSVVVHVDPRTSHYVKVMGYEVFGPQCFASEVIGRYRGWPACTPNFQRIHDGLLRRVRRADVAPLFVQLYEELAPSTIETRGSGKRRAVFDEQGRRRRSSTEQRRSSGAPLGDV